MILNLVVQSYPFKLSFVDIVLAESKYIYQQIPQYIDFVSHTQEDQTGINEYLSVDITRNSERNWHSSNSLIAFYWCS